MNGVMNIILVPGEILCMWTLLAAGRRLCIDSRELLSLRYGPPKASHWTPTEYFCISLRSQRKTPRSHTAPCPGVERDGMLEARRHIMELL